MLSHLACIGRSVRMFKAPAVMMIATGLLFMTVPKSYSGLDLSPDEVKAAAQQGSDRADREVEQHYLEEAKSEGNLSDEGRRRLTDIADMNQQYEKWKDLSRTAGAVAERARRVRALQYKLAELDPSTDFSAPRKRAVWKDEMQYLTKQSPELPELAPLRRFRE